MEIKAIIFTFKWLHYEHLFLHQKISIAKAGQALQDLIAFYSSFLSLKWLISFNKDSNDTMAFVAAFIR